VSEVTVGTELPTIEQTSSLMTSVMYAGASGDMNPLHYDEAFASQVSPTGGIIAHGMYSMGLASRVLTQWAGGPEHVVSVEVRFTKPWPLGSTTTFGGTVKSVEDGLATVELWADNDDGERVLRGTGTARV
jgi:acyl dehydratase